MASSSNLNSEFVYECRIYLEKCDGLKSNIAQLGGNSNISRLLQGKLKTALRDYPDDFAFKGDMIHLITTVNTLDAVARCALRARGGHMPLIKLERLKEVGAALRHSNAKMKKQLSVKDKLSKNVFLIDGHNVRLRTSVSTASSSARISEPPTNNKPTTISKSNSFL